MSILFLLAFLLVVCALAPLFGADSRHLNSRFAPNIYPGRSERRR